MDFIQLQVGPGLYTITTRTLGSLVLNATFAPTAFAPERAANLVSARGYDEIYDLGDRKAAPTPMELTGTVMFSSSAEHYSWETQLNTLLADASGITPQGAPTVPVLWGYAVPTRFGTAGPDIANVNLHLFPGVRNWSLLPNVSGVSGGLAESPGPNGGIVLSGPNYGESSGPNGGVLISGGVETVGPNGGIIYT